MATYPGSLPSFATATDDVTDSTAALYNAQNAETVAVATELGTDPAGSLTDVKSRLAICLADDGTLEFKDSTILTISSGAVTATQNFHRIATEGGAGSDYLKTISGLANDGAILILRPSTANDIILDNGEDNIECVGEVDITLADTDDIALLIYDGNLSVWIASKWGGGGVLTTSPGSANSYVAVYTAAGNIEGTDDLQWDGTTFTIGDGTAARDYILTINGENSDFVATWDEDLDYLKIGDDLLMVDQEKIYFDSTDTYIGANTDDPEDLVIAADQDILLQADNQVVSDTVIRAATTLYRRYYHIAIGAVAPGAAGPTFIPPDGNTVGGWQLDVDTELLYLDADVHSDWDGVSDITVEVKFDIREESLEDETVDLKLVCYYKSSGDSSTKTQTVEVATNVGDGGVKAQWTQFTVEFTIDEDAGGANIDPGDIVSMILNLETDTSEMDNITINAATFYYNTTHIGIEAGDT